MEITQKQLKMIIYIMEWVDVVFSGTTRKEASDFISRHQNNAHALAEMDQVLFDAHFIEG